MKLLTTLKNRVGPVRRRWMKLRLSTALGLVVVAALVMSVWTQARQASVPWHREGGMIGWSEARMIARLGGPARTFDGDLPHTLAHQIRPETPPGPVRTLIFESIDGHFVAWFSKQAGISKCFRSTWLERNTYY